VTDWAVVFLGVIALATLVGAIVQVAVLVMAGRLARRLERLTEQIQRDLKPLFEHLDVIGRDAARATALGTAQVERLDNLLADLAERLDRTLNTLQAAAAGGAREGAAILAAFRAAMSALRDFRGGRARQRSEEDDALFI
jgi:hypothetical protein